jgi:D-alanine-D-alanine ligase
MNLQDNSLLLFFYIVIYYATEPINKEIAMIESLEKEGEKPPSYTEPKKPWFVAVLANIKDDKLELNPDVPADALADYDHIETIQAIQAAIETDGHKTVFIPADRNLPFTLKEIKPDICFNIAEGLGGDAREAQVPALLEMMRIPYTGSRVMANAISLDKTLTKRIWRDRRLPVAPFQEFIIGDEPLRPELRFPLFVKPAREGTGMGVDAKAIVSTEAELRERVKYIHMVYKQPALVETFLSGREFTVGLIGRWDSKKYSRHPEWYDEKHGYHVFPVLELDSSRSVTPGVYSNAAKSKEVGADGAPNYTCPADVTPELARKLQNLAVRAHMAIKAIDVSRSDIRLNAEGEPVLIENNTLPGLTPGYSDLCLEAAAEGIAYEDLILDILYLGASRWGMVEARELAANGKQSAAARGK